MAVPPCRRAKGSSIDEFDPKHEKVFNQLLEAEGVGTESEGPTAHRSNQKLSNKKAQHQMIPGFDSQKLPSKSQGFS